VKRNKLVLHNRMNDDGLPALRGTRVYSLGPAPRLAPVGAATGIFALWKIFVVVTTDVIQSFIQSF